MTQQLMLNLSEAFLRPLAQRASDTEINTHAHAARETRNSAERTLPKFTLLTF